MKKIIALVLVLVMVLSLSTVAFAYEINSSSLLNDTLNIVYHMLGGKENVSIEGNKFIARYDNFVACVARSVENMVNNINRFLGIKSNLADNVFKSITYVWSISGNVR